MGKTPIGVARVAKKYGIHVIGIAGSLSDDAGVVNSHGVDAIFSIMNYPIKIENALRKENATKLMTKNAEQIIRLIKICKDIK